MSTIGILGCGWLGVPLGNHLQQLGHNVRGSRTSDLGVLALQKKGIEGYRVVLEANQASGLDAFLDELDILIISLPPKRTSTENEYVQKIQILIDAISSCSIRRILFLSSTSVYGSAANIYDETSLALPESIAAKALLTSEELLSKHPISSVIIRLGGLIGTDRNPIYSLQQKVIANPKGRINFVHQKDAVKGIAALVSHSALQGIFNLVSPHHPIREEYYREMAQKFNLIEPQFKSEKAQVRIIKGSKITQKTSFDYTVDNLLI